VRKPHVVVLLSGGIDSTACLAYHTGRGARVQALFVDFGQPAAKQESKCASNICRHYGVTLNTLRCRDQRATFSDGLIWGRNAFFLFAALTYFPARAGLICYGAHAGTNYYDCSPRFVRSARQIVQAYSQGTVDLNAPFLKFSKRDILEYCRGADVPLELTYSCERGGAKPCRRCGTCRTLLQIGYYARS
jgi:7-cyano-7-deazaguanine synthase